MTAGFSSSSADQEVHRAISPPRWEQPRAQVRSTLCERDLAPCLAVPSTLPLPQAAALQTQTRLPVGARWTCRQASNILGMYTGSSAPLIPKKRLEKPISIIMSSSFLTAHQSQASSTVYSCMFHPKTGKPFISSPVKSHFPFQKEPSVVSEAAAPGLSLRLQGKAALCSSLACNAWSSTREQHLPSLGLHMSLEMANGALPEHGGDRKGCRLIFLFLHARIHTGSQQDPLLSARKKVLLRYTVDYFLVLLPV